MYNIDVNKSINVIYVVCQGMITRTEGLEILNKLKDTFNKVDTSAYSLIIDSKKVKTTPTEAVDVLKAVMELYTTTPFQKKFFVVPESTITIMQTKRVDEHDFMSSLILVSSHEEALSKIK